jgi:4-amino-4-deoxy-L-arabinose transferase-like glycosyltransferase
MPQLALLAVIASVVLLYLVARRLFDSAWYGGLASALFASTPLLWYQWQRVPASLYPLPFVLAWLWAIERVGDGRGARWAAIAGGALGLGLYTSLAAAVMMPLYLALTVIVFAAMRRASAREVAVMAGTFAGLASPFAFMVARHADEVRASIKAHSLYDAMRFNALQGVHEMVSWVGLTARSEVYYDYFNPAFLFLTGRVLLLPLALLIPIGLYRMLTAESTPFARLAVAGFLTAPFAAALTAEHPVPGRIVFITVFAAIASTYGVRHLQALRAPRP